MAVTTTEYAKQRGKHKISMEFPEPIWVQLDAIAKQNLCSISVIVRQAVQFYLDSRSHANLSVRQLSRLTGVSKSTVHRRRANRDVVLDRQAPVGLGE